ncbi:MAG: hypothetical protein NTW01_15085 [Gammaproteobacteria bacterium]|nr:hypothetical protein [Gammaproteobacteria bacterium]
MKNKNAIRRHDASESRSLTLAAAAMAAVALHLSFAVALIKTGTAGERLHALRAVEANRAVADLGSLPMITVVGRRAG